MQKTLTQLHEELKKGTITIDSLVLTSKNTIKEKDALTEGILF